MSKRIRIAVVDDHPLMREGISAVLSSEADFEIAGTGENASDAIRISSESCPDLMLLDVSMPGCGLSAAREIKAAQPTVRILFLTVSEEHSHVTAALQAGACGYLLKGIGGAELINTIRCVSAGDAYIMPAFAARLLADPTASTGHASSPARPIDGLTQREKQILREVAVGRTNKEVARRLGLSEKTIKHYMTNILQKLGARNRVEAIAASSRMLTEAP